VTTSTLWNSNNVRLTLVQFDDAYYMHLKPLSTCIMHTVLLEDHYGTVVTLNCRLEIANAYYVAFIR